jgi:hypothetical protein
MHPEFFTQAVSQALPKAGRQFLGDAAMLYQVTIEGWTPAEGTAARLRRGTALG